MTISPVHVIGAGLAGCEAVTQLTRHGIPVILHEMRPVKSDEAHKTAYFAELVCSNSLRAGNIENAVGLLKEEMRRLGSLIMQKADKHQVPAGGALAVDRDGFAAAVTEAVKANPLVTVIHEEVTDLESLEGTVIVASGPLTSDALFADIKKLLQADYLHFFDAAAPIVTADSLDYDKVYRASRYDKGGADYLNCPFYTKEEYVAFWEALCNAESAPVKDFEHDVFEACMPIEEMAARGEDTMRFGPLKPVGLIDPRNGKEAYAVVQLRQDNAAASLYNLVGFQTHLKWPEQRRVFGMIPGLENAEFVRFGVMHKNTYLNSPQLLDKHFNLRSNKRFYFAGQMTGVEGYVESAASGLMAGLAAARAVLELPEVEFPDVTAHGALANYISNPAIENFQPMNINFGLIPPLTVRIRKKREKNAQIAARALEALDGFLPTLKTEHA
ncbi:methylenetetrahydrofolate--tRNA-(uracil(54)-C(5))-methyltransferase (FADH(2)-oxidizing) TrmFO [Phascolarctobacterium succinatutens]|uniref:methylenetetrahydrofolate--tRNA-(uracil(54)- C(5))-methyltransferase (FADH(2)-oxidizing) TrmFO n=1 Tax=Phascolarctobacterium succinatutens TaxID=626940 RepID=UPI0026ED1139|nr:methylenetetrahydrofolate--tRNA-(uracil(54)-C(5))-methyltransferase (FADH(2)-oxidizing) TrmFO [Phascolarctobacterium succinatutens]MBS5427111.1 methylenetetrahydrofolate--tRNA-(uracil(54)-C(5))-methyltransferase (FADH(2)-oxidizing) TrmFO [Phascolarctobacterium succinatutens]MEE0509303.1 methylenetetrahydrofolate--tRNA-(uracil(54)-C(5))-methyltransferase (FADH(2)-oxidizing) TrmFO [Phascolarctobacterium succinatutens]